MVQEKKIFAPIFRTYGDNIKKRWRIEWSEPDDKGKLRRCAKPIYISGKTIEDRYNKADIIMSRTDFKAVSLQPAEKSIIEKVFDYKFDWAYKTKLLYQQTIKIYNEWLKRRKPENITPKEFPDFLFFLKNKGHSNSNVEKFRAAVYTLYQYAIDFSLTDKNPVSAKLKIKHTHKSLMFFSDEQIGRFKNEDINTQLWLAIRLLFYCFIRPGELRQMKINWINFDMEYIEIPAYAAKNRKTQKVLIPEHFLKDIAYLKEYRGESYVLSKDLEPGAVQIAANWLNNEHRKILDKLKIRGNYAFYSWKHTGAVKAVKAGINLKDLQMQLRHHSLDMVNEYLKNLGVMDSEDLRYKFPKI